MNQIAAKSGLSVEMLLPILAAVLPMIIDMLTPDGNAPKTGADGGMGQIGDLLGGLLGGADACLAATRRRIEQSDREPVSGRS